MSWEGCYGSHLSPLNVGVGVQRSYCMGFVGLDELVCWAHF